MRQIELELETGQAVSDHGVESVVEGPGAAAGVVHPSSVVLQHQ